MTDTKEVEDLINEYLDELGPEIKAVAKINFSQNNIAATSVSYNDWNPIIRINVQVPL